MSDDAPSRAAGTAVLTVAAAGVGAAVYVISRDWFVIAIWVTGWALIYRVAHTPNHSPEKAAESGFKERPQVNGITVTQVGESCTIVSHPDERRSYGVEASGEPDS